MSGKMMERSARTLFVTATFIIELLITPNHAAPSLPCNEDGYSTDLDDCATYFHCSNNIWNLMLCPDGLIFNINKSECDYPSNVNCSARNNTSSDSVQTTSSTISNDWTTLSATSPSPDLATQSSSMGSDTTTMFTTSTSIFTLTSTSDTTASATDVSAWSSPTSPSPVTSSTPSSMLYSDVTFSRSSSFSHSLDSTSSTSTATSLPSYSTMNPNYMRRCVCYFRVPSNQTLKEQIEDIKKTLKVETKSLSSSVRKVTSAQDRRPSAVVIGTIGIGLILVVPTVIILMDLQRLFLYISSRR